MQCCEPGLDESHVVQGNANTAAMSGRGRCALSPIDDNLMLQNRVARIPKETLINTERKGSRRCTRQTTMVTASRGNRPRCTKCGGAFVGIQEAQVTVLHL